MLTVASGLPPLDPDGYLLRLEDWSADVAHRLADDEGITLTDAHWEVLEVLRAFHERYELSPDNRALVRATRAAKDAGDLRAGCCNGG